MTTVPMPEMTTVPMPEVNRAELWLALFRQLHDSGLPIAEARRQADAQLGFSTGT
jgi:hypothetical protein